MTRINCTHPSTLGHKHLIAELRELPRITKYIIKSLRKHNKNWSAIEKEIPKEWTLNTGHVKYHYDKLTYVTQRYGLLLKEADRRGYNVKARTSWIKALMRMTRWHIIPEHWWSIPDITQRDIDINIERIKQRNGGKQYDDR